MQTRPWYVHKMNANRSSAGVDHFKSLQILDELSGNDSLTQRDLSSKLGIALGLVNSYIKNLVAKGFVTVKSIPPKRYAYYLTPKGLTEKTRLTYDLLHDYTRIYREARKNLKQLFQDLQQNGMKRIVFAGADEIAEIAYLTLQEAGLELAGLVDMEKAGEKFFGRGIYSMRKLKDMNYDCIVVTSYLKRESISRELLNHGTAKKDIRTIFKI